MLTLKIPAAGIKSFMSALLRSETFDFFEIRGLDITTFTHFNISGQKIIPKGEAAAVTGKTETDDETVEKTIYCKWSELRPYAFDMIKGAIRPSYIKIIFSLSQPEALALHENAASMYLNMQFNGDEVYFTSATSQLKFALDKSVDHAWEDYLKEFFAKNQIQLQEADLE